MTTPSYNPGYAEPSASDPQPAQPNQSLGQQARDAWGASGQTGIVNAAKFGYSFGRNAAQQQGPPAPSDGGWGSQGGVSNGNGGDDYATKGDVQSAHDSLQESIQGQQASLANGGVQNRMEAFGQGNGSVPAQVSQAPRPNVMADMANQRTSMLGQMADSHAAMINSMDRRNMVQANRTAQTASIQAPTMSGGLQARGQMQSTGGITGITGSGIGASAGQNESTMSGLLPVQNGISDSNYQNQRFR